jgi:hypothetical protein
VLLLEQFFQTAVPSVVLGLMDAFLNDCNEDKAAFRLARGARRSTVASPKRS